MMPDLPNLDLERDIDQFIVSLGFCVFFPKLLTKMSCFVLFFVCHNYALYYAFGVSHISSFCPFINGRPIAFIKLGII